MLSRKKNEFLFYWLSVSYNYFTLILKKKLDLCFGVCIVDGVLPVLSQSNHYLPWGDTLGGLLEARRHDAKHV